MISRRQFSAMGIASLAGASSGFASTPRKVRAAMIGAGHGHAASKARVLGRMPECEFAGVCRPDEREPINSPERFDGVRWLKLSEVLGDSRIEMVAIEGADPAWNLEYAWRCVRAGKFVHLDKPPGADYSGLRDLLAEARSRGTVVQMGYQWRYHPAMFAALDAARNGWLGGVYRFRASIDKPILAEERRQLAKYKGGMMFSEGCHLIDQATAFLGAPENVSGFLRHYSPLDDGLADNALAILEYPGALAEVSMAGFDPYGNEHRVIEILGTNGRALIQPFSPVRLEVSLKAAAGPYAAGRQTVEPSEPSGYPYGADFLEFFAVMRGSAKPRFSAAHDLLTHRVLLEACGML